MQCENKTKQKTLTNQKENGQIAVKQIYTIERTKL